METNTKETLIKSILYECLKYEQQTKSDETKHMPIRLKTVERLVDFYHETCGLWKYELEYNCKTNNDRAIKPVLDWLNKNNIMYYYIRDEFSVHEYCFYFLSEQDATAFKLKWFE